MLSKVEFIVGLATFVFLCASLVCHCNPSLAAEPDVGLWLARSCMGEVLPKAAHPVEECTGLLNVYKKRAEITGRPLLDIVKAYSASVKPRPDHPHKWVFHLNRELTQPAKWPKTAKWSSRQQRWAEFLVVADMFLAGGVSDPVPLSDHYGSPVDHHRAVRAGWYEIKTPFGNRFYSIKNPKFKKGNKNGN